MIKNSLFIGFLTIFGCSRVNSEYPQVILVNHLESQYDIAKFEAYKLIGGVNCNCSGIINFEGQEVGQKSFSLLTLDLFLVNLEIKNDTVFYYMDFYVKDQNSQMKQTTTLSKSYGDCYDFIGIGFAKESTSPFVAYVDDKGVIDFSDLRHNEQRDSVFFSCIANGTKISSWLQRYLERRKY